MSTGSPTDDGPAGLGARIGDRYSLDARLGSGGMATVYLGRDHGSASGGPVAIKRLHPWLAKEPEFAAAILDEGRVVSRIDHPSVVAMREVVSQDRELFLVLEYVHGEPLSSLRKAVDEAGARVPIPIACALACDLLRGLHAAHEARDEGGRPLHIVHRDVSPQNVIVGVDGRAHLLDFGVAKAVGRLQSTRNGSVKGKLSYMAPEQLRGGAVSRRSDVYAASVVLWELLTGKSLFDRKNGLAGAAERSGVPAAPSSVAPAVPRALDDVVLRGLASEPRDRHATAEAMAQAIEHAVRVARRDAVARWLEEVAAATLSVRSALLARVDPERARALARVAPRGAGRGIFRWMPLVGACALAMLVAALLVHFVLPG